MTKGARFGYGLLILFSLLISLVALFTPGWRSYKGDDAPDFGVISHNCGGGNRMVSEWDCQKWAETKAPFEKITLGLMIVACIFEGLALGFFFALFSTRLHFVKPAIATCGLAFLFQLTAIIIYGIRYSKKIAYMTSMSFELLADVYLGYSYWLAVLATITTLLATAVASGIVGDRIAID